MARYLAIATLGLALVACGGEGDLVVASQATNKAGAAGAAGAGDGLAGKGGSAQGGKAGAAGQPGAAGKGGSAGAGGQGGSAGIGGSGGGAGQSGAAGAGGDPIQPFRTVEQRNPFGNYAESKNLLWDGDFEWAGPFIQQYSWSSTKSWTTAGPPEIIASPGCRSGLKCARLSKGNAATGIGVSPSTAQARLQVWAHVEPGNTCSKVTVYLAACFTSESAKSPLKPTSDTPDAKGWCHYDEQRPTPTSTPCVLISNKSKGVVLVDDVSLGFGSDSAPPSTSKPELPDPDDNALFELLRSDLRKRRKGDEAPQRPSMPTSIPRVRQAPRGR